MGYLDIIAPFILMVYILSAFSLYYLKIHEIYWWTKREHPEIFEHLIREHANNAEMIVKEIRDGKPIKSQELDAMLASLQRRKIHLMAIFYLLAITVAVYGILKLIA